MVLEEISLFVAERQRDAGRCSHNSHFAAQSVRDSGS
jgi:hypothetical protein